MPLTVILTPATLVIEPALLLNETTCPNVRTLNFTPESTNDWRTAEKILGLYELSLSFWNTTSYNMNDPNFFDYYTTPSQPVQQIATLSAYLQRVVVRQDAAIDICGSGWNCSFTVNFTGPGYKCASFTDRDVKVNGTTASSKCILLPLAYHDRRTFMSVTNLINVLETAAAFLPCSHIQVPCS